MKSKTLYHPLVDVSILSDGHLSIHPGTVYGMGHITIEDAHKEGLRVQTDTVDNGRHKVIIYTGRVVAVHHIENEEI